MLKWMKVYGKKSDRFEKVFWNTQTAITFSYWLGLLALYSTRIFIAIYNNFLIGVGFVKVA